MSAGVIVGGRPARESPAHAPFHGTTRSAWIAAAAIANLTIAFGYHWLPVVKLGAGMATDALFVSTVVPQVVLSVIGTSLTSVLTPLLSTASGPAFRTRAWTIGHGVAGLTALVTGALLLVTPLWVPWIVPGFTEEALELTVVLVRIQLLGAFFTMLLAVTWAVSYARDRFLWVEISGAIAGLVCLGGAWWGMGVHGVHAVAWALAGRAALQVALLLPTLGAYCRPDWASAGGRDIWRRLAPLLAGSLYYKADPLVERALASFALPGQLSLFHLAQQIYAAGNQVLTRALINPIMPTLARHAEAGAWSAFRHLVRQRTFVCVGLLLAAWFALWIAGGFVLHAVLGAWLDASQIDLLHALLVLLAGVWFGGAAGQVFTVAFYAYGNTVTPTWTGVVGFTLAIPLKIAGYWAGGIEGLAAATSLHLLGTAVVHLALLWRDLPQRARAAAV